jgi:hypothetical protein
VEPKNRLDPLLYFSTEWIEPSELTLLPLRTESKLKYKTEICIILKGEIVESVARIPYNKWTHVALIKHENRVKLYFNGILDSNVLTEGEGIANDSPLYIGNHPDYVSECEVSGYVDELKFFSRAISEGEVQAEGSAALGNFDSSSVQLGCIDCNVLDAKKSCMEGYHVCTSMEIHSVAYQIAVNQGWVFLIDLS